MKLNTNIKDYYDGAFQYSEDVVYNRINEVVMLTQEESSNAHRLMKGVHGGDVVLGFCGTLYPLLMANDTLEGHTALYHTLPSDVSRLLAVWDKYEGHRYDFWNKLNDPHGIHAFLASAGAVQLNQMETKLTIGKCDEFFIENGLVSFIYYHDTDEYIWKYVADKKSRVLGCNLTVDKFPVKLTKQGYRESRGILIKNPILKDFNFNKIVDPFTAAQEIEMYLGRLSFDNTPIMPVGDDKVLAASKGFDKWSFRKLPTKHMKKV